MIKSDIAVFMAMAQATKKAVSKKQSLEALADMVESLVPELDNAINDFLRELKQGQVKVDKDDVSAFEEIADAMHVMAYQFYCSDEQDDITKRMFEAYAEIENCFRTLAYCAIGWLNRGEFGFYSSRRNLIKVSKAFRKASEKTQKEIKAGKDLRYVEI